MVEAVELYRGLKESDDTTYVVDADLRLVRVNGAWARFAHANHGAAVLDRWGRGASIIDAMAGAHQAFYRAAFERVLATGERWEHDYDCSTDTMFRTFRMVVFPAAGASLVVTNSLRVEHPHDRIENSADDARYLHDGVITMCSSCRRVRAVAGHDRWDWVPDYVRAMPTNVSHGLCSPCAATMIATI